MVKHSVSWYRVNMEHVARICTNFEAADRADAQDYSRLTPQARIDILLELVDRYRSTLGEAAQRFERVCRIDELPRR